MMSGICSEKFLYFLIKLQHTANRSQSLKVDIYMIILICVMYLCILKVLCHGKSLQIPWNCIVVYQYGVHCSIFKLDTLYLHHYTSYKHPDDILSTDWDHKVSLFVLNRHVPADLERWTMMFLIRCMLYS